MIAERRQFLSGVLGVAALAAFPLPVHAQSAGYLQCVPYARELSGVQIYGNANTWWGQAADRYSRGSAPRVGAVMVFKPHRSMRLGHVAYVSRIVDSRTVRLDHANWSVIDGRRGQIERNVLAVDVSPGNDWSEVKVWYHPIQELGSTRWPLHGFIYNSQPTQAREPTGRIARTQPSQAFQDAFGNGI